MKVMHTDSGTLGTASRFSGMGEVCVYYSDGSADSVYIKDLMVWVLNGDLPDRWVGMRYAFDNNLLITNNDDERFFGPKTAEDRERGYTVP